MRCADRVQHSEKTTYDMGLILASDKTPDAEVDICFLLLCCCHTSLYVVATNIILTKRRW